MKNQIVSQSSSHAPPRLRIIDVDRFGRGAVITGASSGIEKEFARQLAAHGVNLVLAARRLAELEALGKELAQQYGVECRSVMVDLSKDGAVAAIQAATRELDVGLVVSNAGMGGTGSFWPGELIAANKPALSATLRPNSTAHLNPPHPFPPR